MMWDIISDNPQSQKPDDDALYNLLQEIILMNLKRINQRLL